MLPTSRTEQSTHGSSPSSDSSCGTLSGEGLLSASWLLSSCSSWSCGLASVCLPLVYSLGRVVDHRRLRRRSRRAQLQNIFGIFFSSVIILTIRRCVCVHITTQQSPTLSFRRASSPDRPQHPNPTEPSSPHEGLNWPMLHALCMWPVSPCPTWHWADDETECGRTTTLRSHTSKIFVRGRNARG